MGRITDTITKAGEAVEPKLQSAWQDMAVLQQNTRCIKLHQDTSRYIKIHQDTSRYIKIHEGSLYAHDISSNDMARIYIV